MALAALAAIGLGAQTVDIYTTVSTDSVNVYATSVMQASTSNSFCQVNPSPCAFATHNYNQAVSIKSPTGRQTSCGYSTSAPATSPVNLQCEAVLAVDGELGAFAVDTADTAVCSVFGAFFNANIPNPITVNDINRAIQQNGLSGVITSVVQNADGSYTVGMSASNFDDLYAAYQTSADCACPTTGNALSQVWSTTSVWMLVKTVQVLQGLGILQRQRTPIKGPPNSDTTIPSPKGASAGKTVRVYGPDGNATHDIDYGDQSHSPWDPEVHDWNWGSGSPVREPPRAPVPGDFPPGVPTTWP